MSTKQELKRRARDRRDRGAFDELFDGPCEVLEDLADGDIGRAVGSTVSSPVRFVKKLFTFDW